MKSDKARKKINIIQPGTRTKRKEAAQAKRWEIRDKILHKLEEFAHESSVNQEKDTKKAFEKTDAWINDWMKKEPQNAQMIKQEALLSKIELKAKLKERIGNETKESHAQEISN
jgi:hypothetical protein